jgi:hypothetical protein
MRMGDVMVVVNPQYVAPTDHLNPPQNFVQKGIYFSHKKTAQARQIGPSKKNSTSLTIFGLYKRELNLYIKNSSSPTFGTWSLPESDIPPLRDCRLTR